MSGRISKLLLFVLALLMASSPALGPAGRVDAGVAEAAQAQTARAADGFVDSIGVATHLTYGDTSYGNYSMIKKRLGESGIRHIRDGWGTGSSYASRFVREELGPLGVRITMVHDPRNNASAAEQKEMVKRELLPVIDAAESLNEWDTKGSGWADYARRWTIDLSQAYRGDPVTRDVPILGPSLADTNNAANHAALGDLSSYVNFGNTHDYPGNQYMMNDSIIDTVLRNQALLAPGRPVMATETGYSNGPVGAPYPAMPEAQAGQLLPRIYFEHFRRGLPRTFAYELLDERSDDGFESRFGLLRSDGTPKPAFSSVSALISLLSDPGPSFSPGSLAFQLAGTDAATRTLLLQKRDGTFWLAVWQQTNVWDGSRVLDPPNRQITLSLDRAAKSVRVFAPTRGGVTPQASYGSTASVTFQSSEDMTLLEVGGVASGRGHRPKAVQVSDQPVQSLANGWGPMEKDTSNGEAGARDGRRLSIAGRSFAKGLGVHAPSRVQVPVDGAQTFTSWIGVDNETRGKGSVTFAVWADGVRLAHSGVVRGGQRPRALSVDVRGRQQLTLVVMPAGDGNAWDHADWGDAMLR